jgi:CheY-like chemotaxis protein
VAADIRSRPETVTRTSGTETVLLVEDDDQVRSLAGGILRRCGYRVLDAQNGGEALLIADEHPAPIDLLVTDVIMPRMNGRQLATRLTSRRPELQVLYMSGYTDDVVLRDGVRNREVAFLRKPFSPESLARRVREVLDKARGLQSAQA